MKKLRDTALKAVRVTTTSGIETAVVTNVAFAALSIAFPPARVLGWAASPVTARAVQALFFMLLALNWSSMSKKTEEAPAEEAEA